MLAVTEIELAVASAVETGLPIRAIYQRLSKRCHLFIGE
jgi:hypothetical protein